MKRLIGSILLACPLAWLATVIGDSTSSEALLQAIVSPGMTLVLNMNLRLAQGGWLDQLSYIGMTALAINLAYYMLICYGFLRVTAGFLARRPLRKSSLPGL